MKNKKVWLLVSVLVVLGLIVGSVACAPAASTVTVTTTVPGATTTVPRAQGRTDVPWDSRAYFPISMQGKKLDMTYVLQAHPIWLNWAVGAKEANQAYGFDISYFDANLSAQTLSNIADGSISRKVDLAMISPIDAVTGSPVYQRLHDAGIPVIGLATATDYLADITLAVDWYAMGKQSGEWLAQAINGTGEVGIVVGDFTTPSGVGRVKGVEDALAQYPNIKIVATVDTPTGPWTRQGAYDSAKGIMSSNPNLTALFGVDDELGVGCALAVKDSGKKGKITVVATQGSKASMQAIVDGDIAQMTIWSPYQMGKESIIAASYILSSPGYKAGTMQGVSWTELISVTKDNVNSVPWPPA
jgi:ABC-type sugar transport system substrate-binding protein